MKLGLVFCFGVLEFLIIVFFYGVCGLEENVLVKGGFFFVGLVYILCGGNFGGFLVWKINGLVVEFKDSFLIFYCILERR